MDIFFVQNMSAIEDRTDGPSTERRTVYNFPRSILKIIFNFHFSILFVTIDEPTTRYVSAHAVCRWPPFLHT